MLYSHGPKVDKQRLKTLGVGSVKGDMCWYKERFLVFFLHLHSGNGLHRYYNYIVYCFTK